MKSIFLLIFILSHLSINSQTLKGVVFDSISKEKLQYVNLSLKSKEIGTFCNEDGAYNFNLSKALITDTLVISLIGYHTKNIELTSFIEKEESILNIELSPKTELLKEVVVVDDNQRYSTKISNLKTGNKKTIFPKSVSFGRETAVLIENKKNKKGKLIELILKLKEQSNQDYKIFHTYYRVTFYEKEKSGYPGEVIDYENIIIKPKKDDTSYKLDLEHKNIEFSENGIFIGIETVKPDEIEATGSMYLTTPNIVYTHTEKKITFRRFGSNNWTQINRKSVFKKKLYEVPFLKVKVVYLKE